MNWKCALSFLAGLAAGAGITYKLIESRYNQKMEERVKSIYETVDKKEKLLHEMEERLKAINEDNQAKSQANLNKPDPEEIVKKSEKDFKAYDKLYEPENKDLSFEEASDDLDSGETDVNSRSDLEYISAEDYGATEGYSNYIWTYTADGVLLDDNNDPIEPVEMIDSLGHNFEEHFGELDPDELNVRNHTLKLDIKVIPSQKNSYEFNN